MTRSCLTSVSMIAILLLTGIALIATPRAQAYPQPDILSDSWQLEFEYDKPGVVTVDLPDAGPTKFWYLPYTVTNDTGSELVFVPHVTIYTDAGDLILAPRKVPPVVFDVVKKELRNPLLESPVDVIGPLLQGEDNARDSVVLWPAPKHDVDSFRVFIGGLSGETTVLDPDGTVIPDKPAESTEAAIRAHSQRKAEGIVLRKTFMIEVSNPGDRASISRSPIIVKRDGWIMR